MKNIVARLQTEGNDGTLRCDNGYFAGHHPSVIRLGGPNMPFVPARLPSQEVVQGPPPYNAEGFGSAHVGSFNAVMGDRSPRRIRYGVQSYSLCNRTDGQLINWTQCE